MSVGEDVLYIRFVVEKRLRMTALNYGETRFPALSLCNKLVLLCFVFLRDFERAREHER